MRWDPAGLTLRCLIVDDSRAFLDAASGLLEREGASVVGVASSSAEALDRCVALRPDVVLVDVDLGGESGIELAGRLAELAAPARVVLISTHAESELDELIRSSAAVGFLPKAVISRRRIAALLSAAGAPRDT